MFQIDVLAAGKLKKGPLSDLCFNYKKRLLWPFTITEIDGYNQKDEETKFLRKIKPEAFVIALDERGKAFKSREFAEKIEQEENVQFIIGGADGLTPPVREKAHLILSFGEQTWPHMLARVMLLEQIYRAQQILSGHPYHRE